MRVFRFIVRFLGISALIFWALSSLVFAQDNNDVTVNFPDQMNVSGSVEITNLGITGDPVYDVTEYPVIDVPSVDSSNTSNLSNLSTTYISGYTRILIWSTSFWAHDMSSNLNTTGIYLSFPQINFGQLRSDFYTALFGTRFGSDSNTILEQRIFPGFLGGRNNLGVATESNITSTITDSFGGGSWSIQFPWEKIKNPSLINPGTGNYYDIKAFLTFILSFATWYEVLYLIIGKVSQA